MAKILVHALAATAGGGATYLRNFLAKLRTHGAGHRWVCLVPAGLEVVPPADHVELRRVPGGNAARRVYHDQILLRRVIAREGIDLVLATGNFGMLRPPVPQVLLSRNALYFSPRHLQELRGRLEFRELLATAMRRRLAIASIRDSALNIVPTAAFAADIRAAVGDLPEDRFRVIPHGFDAGRFLAGAASPELLARLSSKPGVRRVLMVSHYNYFRNFETLLEGFAKLRDAATHPVELVLTTKLGVGVKDHRYDTSHAARLAARLGLGDDLTMLGTVPHAELAGLYRVADVVVCPSYAESFGHPMVEAMASGCPVVASDRGCQREMCGDAAVYFPTFDGAALADRLGEVLADPALAAALGERGRRRAAEFSWDRHFRDLIAGIESALPARAMVA